MPIETMSFEMSNSTLGAPPADQENLRKLTEQYVKATRKYADDLGKEDVTRRLAEKAAELEPVCLTCAQILDRERQTYYGHKAGLSVGLPRNDPRYVSISNNGRNFVAAVDLDHRDDCRKMRPLSERVPLRASCQ